MAKVSFPDKNNDLWWCMTNPRKPKRRKRMFKGIIIGIGLVTILWITGYITISSTEKLTNSIDRLQHSFVQSNK